MTGLRIAVVGAGPGGLVLARILGVHGIAVTVFEGETDATARAQGGSLDMHADGGQFALAQAGLTEAFKRIARYEDQETRVYDRHGMLRFEDGGSFGDRPEVDRGHLRQMLIDSLGDGVIRWGHRLSDVALSGEGGCELGFRNGVKERFDLVVGADGTWSQVRPLVSQARPVYSGVMFVEMGIDDVDRQYPTIARMVGRGLMFALGDRKALIGHRDAGAHIGIYAALRTPEDWVERGGMDGADGNAGVEAKRARLAGYFDGWSEDLLQLIYRAEGEMTPRPIYALPVGHKWEHQRGVTLLGDAAHVMSPFSGEGANLAMRDGADLALALAGALAGGWDAAVRAYEEKMQPRAEEAAAGAQEGIDGAFSEDGLADMLRQMESQRGGG